MIQSMSDTMKQSARFLWNCGCLTLVALFVGSIFVSVALPLLMTVLLCWLAYLLVRAIVRKLNG